MPEKILVVDDDPVNREVLSTLLADNGFRVSCAEGGREALEALAKETFSLILLDLVMEDMSGLEVLREVRQSNDLMDLPILMVSANHDCPPMVEALELGANDYLTKPVAAPLLVAKVRRHLALRRAQSTPPAPLQGATRNNSQDVHWTGILQPGTRISHYEILSFLGEGAMGRVYRARDVRLLRHLAIKVLLGDWNGGTKQLERFGNEALAVARISHPNVVALYDIGNDPVPFLAMELIDGVVLGGASHEFPLQVEQALHWCLEILEGLAAAHAQSVVHRDLKPENVMITRSGQVKLMDFGVAKLVEYEDHAMNGELVGTPEFMSPEQIDNSFGKIGPRSDLFAVAGLLYIMLTNSPPFPAIHQTQQFFSIVFKEPVPPRELNPLVSAELEAICLKGLRKEQSRRFQTAQEFSEALRGQIKKK